MENSKKAFDSTVCFTFFRTWVESIQDVKDYMGETAAFCLYSAIADYSMYDIEPDFSEYPFLRAVWRTIEREIDSSIDNRKRGFAKDASNEKYQAIIDAIVENPDLSLRKIGELTGTSKNMVDLVRKKYRSEIEAAIADKYVSPVSAGGVSPVNASVIAAGGAGVNVGGNSGVNVGVNDIVSAGVNDIVNDSTGRDTTGQAGQTQNDNVSVLDKIIIDIDNTSPDAVRVRSKWNNLYYKWRKSIETKDVRVILDMYLLEHEESPYLQKIGDKYGRIIDGWNAEAEAPNIVYSFTGFPRWRKHNLSGIPVEYYRLEDEELYIEEEREAMCKYYEGIGVDMSSYEEDEDGEMPF